MCSQFKSNNILHYKSLRNVGRRISLSALQQNALFWQITNGQEVGRLDPGARVFLNNELVWLIESNSTPQFSTHCAQFSKASDPTMQCGVQKWKVFYCSTISCNECLFCCVMALFTTLVFIPMCVMRYLPGIGACWNLLHLYEAKGAILRNFKRCDFYPFCCVIELFTTKMLQAVLL